MNPSITNMLEEGSLLKFTLSGVNVSLANAVRRIVLSEIPTVVFKTETYQDNHCNITVNTTRLHNEILKLRLSCVPVHMKLNELDILPGKYILEVDEKNETDSMSYVTTEHFKIKNKTTGNYLTKEETKKIFPPNRKTNYYIDFARLRPKISDTIPGEALKLTADVLPLVTLGTRAHSMWFLRAYGNTPDVGKIKDQWDTQEAKLKSQETPSSDIEFQKRNFYILDAQRQYVPDSFDFVVQTIGMYENKDILKMANKILVGKFDALIQEIDSDTVEILTSETTMDHCYDIILKNEDYTVGKVLEFILYEKHYQGDKSLSFCGFKKFHPHDVTSTVRVAFNAPSDKTVVKQRLRSVCVDAQEIFTKIGGMF